VAGISVRLYIKVEVVKWLRGHWCPWKSVTTKLATRHTSGERDRLLVAFERLAESTTTAFFDQDVLRALQDLRNTPAEVSPPRGPPPPGEVAPV
jgi:hypothetical protein